MAEASVFARFSFYTVLVVLIISSVFLLLGRTRSLSQKPRMGDADTNAQPERPAPASLHQMPSAPGAATPQKAQSTANRRASSEATIGSVVAHLAGLGIIVGAGIGTSTLIVLHNLDAFGDAISAVILGGFVWSISMLVAISVGMVIAAIGAWYVLQRMPSSDRETAAWAGGLGGGVAHAGLVLTLWLVLLVGFAILAPAGDEETSESTDGDGAPSVPEGSDLGLLGALATFIPAGLVGAGTTVLLRSRASP